MRRVLTIGVVLILIACLAIPVILLTSPQTQAGGQPSSASLEKTVIERGDLKLTVSATGSVIAKQDATLSFDQPGRVQEVLVEEGQRVQAGQLLMRLDDTAQQAALDQANSSLKAAQAALQNLLKPVDAGLIANAEANIKAAQAVYSAIANAVSMDRIKALELQYQQAQAAVDSAEAIRRDAGGQYAQDDPGYQKALAQVGQAAFAAEQARLRLQQARNGRSLLSATARIALAQIRLAQVKAGPRQIDIDTLQAQVVNAQLLRDQAQHQLDKTRLTAPFAGVITSVKVKPGEVSAGPAITLMDHSSFFVDVNVDEVDIGRIQAGQPVDFTLDGLPGTTLTGTVQRIAQIADENTAVIKYAVRVVPDPTTQPLKVNMTANAVFTVRDVKNVLRVPNQYLRIDRANKTITVNRVNADGSLTEIPVTLGLEGTDYSEVLSGLDEGDTIALSGVRTANPFSGN
jgi:HlyD family secretion protein